jgi:hypothetical protein
MARNQGESSVNDEVRNNKCGVEVAQEDDVANKLG